MKTFFLETINNVFSCALTLFYIGNLGKISYCNRIRAFLDGKSLFKAYLDNEVRVMYASSIEQARSKFTGHKVQYIVE